jgi:hypothetical protein
MIFSFYDPETGIIQGHINCQDSVADQVRAQPYTVPGFYEAGQYRVNQFAQIEPVDTATTTQFDRETQLRFTRDQQLTQVDRVNPIWYATLSTEQQQQLAGYRQALLDLPQQAGWPNDIIWPVKPNWL